MVAFTNLPPEMILEIAKNVEPPHLANFYGISQNVYVQTKEHREKYQALKRKFAQPLSTSHPGSTAELLKSIMLEPETALYVQQWRLDHHRMGWGAPNPREPEHVEYSEADMMILESAIRESPHLHDEDKDQMVQAMRNGDEEKLIVVALTKMPNLTSVILQDSNDDIDRLPISGPIYSTINLMVSDSLSLSSASHGQSTSPLMPSLDQVWVEPGFKPVNLTAFIDAGAIEAFAALPSVREINGYKIGGYAEDIELAEPVENSQVTVLKLSMCDMSLPRMFLFLEGFTHLQEFTYWPNVDAEMGQPYEPLLVVRALMFGAKNTLRRLTLRSASAEPSYMGSLRRFKALEYLETDLASILGQSDTTDRTLQDGLPPTMQEIKLFDRGDSGATFDYSLGALADNKESFPRLSRFTIVQKSGAMTDDEMEDWKKALEEAGILLEFEDYDQVLLPLFAKSHANFPYYMGEGP